MNLTNYQSIYAILNDNKFVRKGDRENSNLVIDKDGDSENYNFLLFPVNPEKTENTDFFYIIHADTGLAVQILESNFSFPKPFLGKVNGGYNEHWSFKEVEDKDSNEAFQIQNRTDPKLVWKLSEGETVKNTEIVIQESSNYNSYFQFKIQNPDYTPYDNSEIKNPELVGYDKRFEENEINDINLVPPATKTSASYHDTSQVIIGESSTPYYMIEDDYNRDLPQQVRDTPYYITRRSQYWSFLGNEVLQAGQTRTENYSYTYGASKTQSKEFNSISDWTLGTDLSIIYGNISQGISGSVSESLEIKKSINDVKSSEETGEIEVETSAESYKRIYYYWQIVDVITILDGTGEEITSVEVPGKATETTVYNETGES